MTVDVHQCFRCDLRFATKAELEYHLAVDHETRPAELDRSDEPTAAERR
jgi:hypothetical protein